MQCCMNRWRRWVRGASMDRGEEENERGKRAVSFQRPRNCYNRPLVQVFRRWARPLVVDFEWIDTSLGTSTAALTPPPVPCLQPFCRRF